MNELLKFCIEHQEKGELLQNEPRRVIYHVNDVPEHLRNLVTPGHNILLSENLDGSWRIRT